MVPSGQEGASIIFYTPKPAMLKRRPVSTLVTACNKALNRAASIAGYCFFNCCDKRNEHRDAQPDKIFLFNEDEMRCESEPTFTSNQSTPPLQSLPRMLSRTNPRPYRLNSGQLNRSVRGLQNENRRLWFIRYS